jgi:hypothetical protein
MMKKAFEEPPSDFYSPQRRSFNYRDPKAEEQEVMMRQQQQI